MSRKIYHSPIIEQLRGLIAQSADAQGLSLADDLDEQKEINKRCLNWN